MSLVCLIAHSLPPLFVKEGSIAHASHKNDGGTRPHMRRVWPTSPTTISAPPEVPLSICSLCFQGGTSSLLFLRWLR